MHYGDCRALVLDCARNRDLEPWREFERLFRDRLVFGVRRAMRRSGSEPEETEVEDYLQEVYCRLLEREGRVLRLCRGDTKEQIGSYLQTVAERAALDVIRRQTALKRGGGAWSRVSPKAAESWIDNRRTTSPEEHALLAERRRLFFAKCRSALGAGGSRRDLYILYLALFERCSSVEISERLSGQLSPCGVDSRISRLRERLRRREGLELPRRGRW